MFSGSMRDVARVLVSRERETMDLKRTLYTLTEQLKAERQRADAAENKTREVLAHFKSATEAKMAAEQEAARANETLRLYKLQYENAQMEIRRAQKLIDSLELQRVDAEEVAAKARSMARKMKEEAIVLSAKEAGRRQGIEEGLRQGRLMGYEEGRLAGYEDARTDTERAYTAGAMTEPYPEDTPRQAYRPPRVSRPSTSEDSEGNTVPTYARALDESIPVPPPARMPTPAAPVMPREEPMPQDPPSRPVTIHNVMSPSHPPTDVPPDGWIPKIDEDQRIRLPPPHEMGPPPPTTPSPPLSAVLNNVRNIEEPPAVMIPPPVITMPMPEDQPSSAPRRPRHRRRNSDESQSTTMSQFEILGPPSTHGTLRSQVRERPPVLSAIAEERERTSSGSSPIFGMPNASTHSFQMPSPGPQMPVPSPNMPMPSPQPPAPTYPTPESMSRYRSTESLPKSGVPDNRYAPPEPRSRSRASSTDDGRRYETADDYYRRRPGDTTPRQTPAHTPANIYHSPAPPATPRYERPPDDRSRSGNVYADGASRSGSVRGYPSRDNLSRTGSRSELGRRSEVDDISRTQNIYAPPRSPHSSPESPAIVAPTPSLRPPTLQPDSNRGSMSSNEITFTVVPPSRPESNISRHDTEAPGSFLSADDADRPLPPLPSDGAPDTTGQPPAPTNPVIPPTVMLNGPWPPPGFMPTGPPSPSQPGAPPSAYGGSSIGPAGVPLPPSTVGGTPSVRSEVPIPGTFPGAATEGSVPVIPRQLSSKSSQSAASSSRRAPYSRSKVAPRDTDSDSSTTSSGMGSNDSLTTPPARTRKLSGRATTPRYAAADLPSHVTYPVPPTPRSTTSTSLGSSTTRAARVPLPASVAGSAVGSAVGTATPGPLNRKSPSIVGATRTPSETSRPRSPRMGGGIELSPRLGGRNVLSPRMGGLSLSPNRVPGSLPGAEPVIPIPIPEPPAPLPVQIIPMPTSPRAGPLGDLEPIPIVPAVERAPSPSASAVTATTGAGSTAKGGKKTKKKGKK
ncbi:hypothetical protein BD413DRAFT_611755 [Trametes elegans]|nr:hypothetical protein BD413DRAFT_611755 [Trametes elegans]